MTHGGSRISTTIERPRRPLAIGEKERSMRRLEQFEMGARKLRCGWPGVGGWGMADARVRVEGSRSTPEARLQPASLDGAIRPIRLDDAA
jgi:hypothetical protein